MNILLSYIQWFWTVIVYKRNIFAKKKKKYSSLLTKDVHILILIMCRYATVQGKWDFADMDLEMRRLLWITWLGPV